MKKLFSILSLLIFAGLWGQTPSLPIYKVNNLSITAPVKGSKSDSVLVWRGSGDKVARYLPASDLDHKVSDFNKSYIAPYSTGNVRNSESDIIVRGDGSYLCVYSRFYIGSQDNAPAKIMAKISNDAGDSWGAEFQVSANIGAQTVLSPSLVRIDASTIHCYFLVVNSDTDLRVYRSISNNDGSTWASPTEILSGGYNGVLSASVKKVNGGRILIPVQKTTDISNPAIPFDIFTYYSDDSGVTWSSSNVVNSSTAMGETSILYLGGNAVKMVIRSASGFQLFSDSSDNGTTWGTPYVSTLKSVSAPAQILKYGTTLIAFHNPNTTDMRRNPLTISKSLDNGVSWIKITDLENANTFTTSYAYPSLTFDSDNLLVSYFELPNNIGGIGLKFAKINLPDLLSDIVPVHVSADETFMTGLTMSSKDVVDPRDNVTKAIGKLQAQINDLKGSPFRYEGTDIAQYFKNTDSDNIMKNLYTQYVNTNNAIVAQIGFLSSNQNFYIYTDGLPVQIAGSNILLNAPTEVFYQLKIQEPTLPTSAASKGYVDSFQIQDTAMLTTPTTSSLNAAYPSAINFLRVYTTSTPSPYTCVKMPSGSWIVTPGL